MTLTELFEQASMQAKLVAEQQKKGRELQKLSKENYSKGADYLAYSRATRKALIDTVIRILDESQRQGKPLSLAKLVSLLDTDTGGVRVEQRYLYKAIVRERKKKQENNDEK